MKKPLSRVAVDLLFHAALFGVIGSMYVAGVVVGLASRALSSSVTGGRVGR